VLGEPQSVKIAVLEAPQDEATADSPDNTGNKPGRGRTVLLVRSGAEDFVQRA
jgi:hypothetical protein